LNRRRREAPAGTRSCWGRSVHQYRCNQCFGGQGTPSYRGGPKSVVGLKAGYSGIGTYSKSKPSKPYPFVQSMHAFKKAIQISAEPKLVMKYQLPIHPPMVMSALTFCSRWLAKPKITPGGYVSLSSATKAKSISGSDASKASVKISCVVLEEH
jgi:hypothetical protein